MMKLLYFGCSAFLPTAAIVVAIVLWIEPLYGFGFDGRATSMQFSNGKPWAFAAIGGLIAGAIHLPALKKGGWNLPWCAITMPLVVAFVFSLGTPYPGWATLVALDVWPWTFGTGALTALILSKIARRQEKFKSANA